MIDWPGRSRPPEASGGAGAASISGGAPPVHRRTAWIAPATIPLVDNGPVRRHPCVRIPRLRCWSPPRTLGQCPVRSAQQPAFDVRVTTSADYMVPMRDGVKLFTIVYTPRDTTRSYPVILFRTPYSIPPYEADAYRARLGPSSEFDRDGYIFVFQDARGKFRSEGDFEVMRPFKAVKKTAKDVDESSDTYDTIDWTLKNIPGTRASRDVGSLLPRLAGGDGHDDPHPALRPPRRRHRLRHVHRGRLHHNGAFRRCMVSCSPQCTHTSGQGSARDAHSIMARPMATASHGSGAPARTIRLLPRRGPGVERIHAPSELRRGLRRRKFSRISAPCPPISRSNVAGWFDAEDFPWPASIYYTLEKLTRGIAASSRSACAARRLEQHGRRPARQHRVRLDDESATSRQKCSSRSPVSPQDLSTKPSPRRRCSRQGERVAHLQLAAEDGSPRKLYFTPTGSCRSTPSHGGSISTSTTPPSGPFSSETRTPGHHGMIGTSACGDGRMCW